MKVEMICLPDENYGNQHTGKQVAELLIASKTVQFTAMLPISGFVRRP